MLLADRHCALSKRVSRLTCRPDSALCVGLWLQLGLALALLSAVIALAWPLRSLDWARDYVHTAYGHLGQGPCGLKIYTVVFSLLPFGFIMPIFGPWERVQLWVRWHPYNLDAELLWRGTFATFACALFLTAANPKACFVGVFPTWLANELWRPGEQLDRGLLRRAWRVP